MPRRDQTDRCFQCGSPLQLDTARGERFCTNAGCPKYVKVEREAKA